MTTYEELAETVLSKQTETVGKEKVNQVAEETEGLTAVNGNVEINGDGKEALKNLIENFKQEIGEVAVFSIQSAIKNETMGEDIDLPENAEI